MIFRVPCSLPCCPRDASRGLMPTPVLQGVNLASLGLLTTALHLQKETESLRLNSLNLSRGRASLGRGKHLAGGKTCGWSMFTVPQMPWLT